MRRIMNNVAVATLLYTMRPDTVVRIADVNQYIYTSQEDWSTGIRGTEYTVDEILHDYKNTKIANAAIHHTAVNNGQLMLVVDTDNERY